GTFTPAGTGYATYTTAAFDVTAGNHTIRFVGVDPSGADYTALLDGVSIDTLAPPASSDPNFVDLSSAFNRMGIAAAGATAAGGGPGGSTGHALPPGLAGPPRAAGGPPFVLGPAGVKDVVSAAGQVIPLPAGNDAALKLLATGVNGWQLNQAFVVTYTDGTTATFVQSFSGWANTHGFVGESTALTAPYYDTTARPETGPAGRPSEARVP